MKEFQKEVHDLQLKIHGQFSTIDYNGINEKFYAELNKEGIDIDNYQDIYQKLSDHYSVDYRNNKDVKENSDSEFAREVVSDMKRLIEIASLIKIK